MMASFSKGYRILSIQEHIITYKTSDYVMGIPSFDTVSIARG